MGHRQEELNWEAELWDAFPQLSNNALQSISWLQKFGKISNGLHKLNKDYGKGLAKLVKKESKAGEDGTSVSVCHKGVMQHLLGLASKHKQIAVSLGAAAREYDGEAKRLIEEHKTVESEAKKLQGELESSKLKLEKSREKFQKRQIEADHAEDCLTKAEPDSRVSRAELERLKEDADDKRSRANRSRDEYSQQLLLTNSHQKGFYRETWPKIFSQLQRVGQDAGDGVHELLTRLVSGGLDQWPEPVEAWGEIDNCRELLDYRGDFSSFVIWSKSGNPCPKDFSFVEPPKNSGFTPMTTMGTLRRSISRQSLRYRTSTIPRNSAKFPSMFSVRNGSIKSRGSHKRSQSNIEDVQKSTDTIDQIEEEEIGNEKKDVAVTVSQELKILTTTINSYVEDDDETLPSANHTESNGHNESYADIELNIEDEPEKASTPIESEKEDENPFENSEESTTPIESEKNKINPFETELETDCDMKSSDEEIQCEPITVTINGIESDKSLKDDEICENSKENETTESDPCGIVETNGVDVNSCKSDEGDIVLNKEVEVKSYEKQELEVDSNDNISISGRNYKYDDRKNPFMDEIFDESFSAA